MKKFQEQRYLTKGIKEHLDVNLQITLWRLIENLDIEVDYLQVFELEQLPDRKIQITHKQEEPEYKSITVHSGVLPVNKLKIYVIDDFQYSTMLLADEH